MGKLSPIKQARVLIVDDNAEIHQDIRRVLETRKKDDEGLTDLEADIFDEEEDDTTSGGTELELDSAYQGQEGLELVKKSLDEGRPYAMAFVDMRMPPGWDGLETVQHIWEVDSKIEVVICTAFSDNPWDEVISTIGHNDKLLILKKPFEMIEVQQMARALTTKWILSREVEERLDNLEVMVKVRTQDLESTNDLLQNEIKERERVEVELRHAQKLEAVGQLAAGIAHEINTPIQFVGDSVRFLKGAFEDLENLIGEYKKSYQFLSGQNHQEMLSALQDKEKAIDLDYLEEEVPKAISDTMEGITRVAAIVSAMKQFSHPAAEMAAADINKALQTTITVAGSEYKYVADIKTEFSDELPRVMCQLGDINQVFLNLIVNASHAIADAHGEGERGLITIKTEKKGDIALISIADDGSGIPEKARNRIFDPFFTTKEVGRGTGQGLAIAHSIVVDKHGGQLHFETELGKGTTFFIELPIEGKQQEKNTLEKAV